MTRARTQRGAVFPSPVVILSVIAIAVAGLTFWATRGGEPAEREVTPVVKHEPSASAAPSTSPAPKPKPKPVVHRGKIYVEVYNNSGITGLAGKVAGRASGIGWKVVGSDNWYGTIPETTVYYPKALKKAAKTLALDLGIRRTAPAIDPMRRDRLTIILTGPLG